MTTTGETTMAPPTSDERLDDARERLAGLEEAVRGLRTSVDGLTASLELRQQDVRNLERRLWRVSVTVAAIAGGMGAGGASLVQLVVGG